jgi:hypothetical protein
VQLSRSSCTGAWDRACSCALWHQRVRAHSRSTLVLMAQTMLLSGDILGRETSRAGLSASAWSAYPRYSRRDQPGATLRWQLCGLLRGVRVARKSDDSLYDRKAPGTRRACLLFQAYHDRRTNHMRTHEYCSSERRRIAGLPRNLRRCCPGAEVVSTASTAIAAAGSVPAMRTAEHPGCVGERAEKSPASASCGSA